MGSILPNGSPGKADKTYWEYPSQQLAMRGWRMCVRHAAVYWYE